MRSAIAGNGDRLRAVHARSAVASRSGSRPGARRATERSALDFAAVKGAMSDKEISALRPGAELKPGPQATIAAITDQSQAPRIPGELSILPMRGFVVFRAPVVQQTVQRAAP